MGSHYCHLKLDERRKLAKWLEAKMPIAEIADRLGRNPSTIYRDIKRNRYTDTELPELNGYYALNAQDMYEKRRAIHRKMIVHPDLKAAIEDRLKAGWSPEQIAGRMRLERHPIRVSHETIYRFAYSKDGRDEQFYRHLPEHRRRRRPRGYRRHNRTHIFDVQSLSHRPDRISERTEFGHWECDLMMFRKEHGKVNVTSLVERVSRFAVVMRNEDRQSKPIMEALIQGLAPLPAIRASQSPLTVAPSSRPGGTSRPGSAQMRGFVIHRRRTRKAPSRIRTTGCGSTCPVQPNRRR